MLVIFPDEIKSHMTHDWWKTVRKLKTKKFFQFIALINGGILAAFKILQNIYILKQHTFADQIVNMLII